VKQTRQHSPLPLHTSDVRFEWTQKVTRDQLAMQLSSVQMMSRALLVAGAVLSTSFAAKLAAAPSIQQDGIVSLLASSSPVAGTMAAKNKAAEMEQMVLLLAQQAKVARKSTGKADGDVQVFVDMIKKELAKMEAKIKEAAGIVDASCKDTFANLSAGCPIYAENTTFLPSGFDGDFGSLREAHSTCRSQISSRKQEMDSCKSSRESLILQEHTLTSQFRSINIFESPEECSVKGTDVLGYLASMRDHFDGKKTTWWATYYKLENVTKNITKWNCTEKELAYYDKLAECAQKQLGLEETACELHARTKEACALLPSCFNKNWKNYAKQVALANATISDLRFEYVAVKRIMCMLDAFSSDDVEAKIENCMAKKYSGAAISSGCVEGFGDASLPSFITPDVCKNGVKAILHPSDENFNETEYASQGIAASPCMATCCDLELYHWSTYTNAFVTSEHYMYDSDTGRMVTFTNMVEAKQACETMGSVLCFGIYDANCDGPSWENPVKIIKAPGIDMESVKESSVGSCVEKLMTGPGTTVTTTTVRSCIYEIEYTSSKAPEEIKTMMVEHQEYGEAFRFTGCDNEELEEGKACVNAGAQNGVRLLKNRYGQAVGTGSCCTSETNKVVKAEAKQCDGYKDEYTKFAGKYFTATSLIRGTSYYSVREAEIACLKMGHKCWGLFDDKCDMGNLMLVDGALNITESSMHESHQSSCIYEKLKA